MGFFMGIFNTVAKGVFNSILSLLTTSATIWDYIQNANTIFAFVGGFVGVASGCLGFYYLRLSIETKKLERDLLLRQGRDEDA